MLESIRKRRNSFVILLAFAAIIVVFIFWGVGPNGGDQPDSVIATVDGEAIPVKEYANLYKREMEYYRNTFKEQFTDEMAEKLDLKRKALDILINRALAIKEANAQGIEVSDAEVQEAIKAIPVFGKNGAFDKETYFKVLSSNRINPADFESSVKADLVTARIREKVLKDVSVTEDEARQRYMKENRKLDVAYASVDALSLKAGVKVTDEEAKEYLKKNASDFMLPAEVKAFYAFAGYRDFAKKAKVTDDEVREYYEKNKKEFETPGAVKARHILLRPDPKAADQQKAKAEARKRLEEILARVKSGARFADLAKAHSEDPGSARQGGDLGWFQKGIMIKAFEDAAFELPKGEVSGVIETEFGFHIIKVEDRKDAGFVPMAEAAKDIRGALAGHKGASGAREALTALDAKLAKAANADEMKKIASADRDMKVTVTGFFTEEGASASAPENTQLRSAAFSLSAGQGFRIVEAEDGAWLVRTIERKEARTPEFAEVAAEIKDIIAEQRASEAARKKAGEVIERTRKGEDLKSIAKAEGLSTGSTGYFSRAEGFMPKTGVFVGDKDGLFELAVGSHYPEAVSQGLRNFIFVLSGAKEADPAGFEPKKEEFKARVLAEKQDAALNAWLKGLREKAEITVNEGLL